MVFRANYSQGPKRDTWRYKMSAGDEKEFKVTDRRASSGAKDSEKPSDAIKGEGFTAKPKAENENIRALDFSTLILSFGTGAMIYMGMTPDPHTKKVEKNLEAARQNIDILALLSEKTRGNLSKDEQALLDNMLSELRLLFVRAST